MKSTFVMTVIGPDRPGIVNQLSNILTQHNANWHASRMANLVGEFAGILHASVDQKNYQTLVQDLQSLKSSDLDVLVRLTNQSSDAKPGYRLVTLDVVGTDREGIVKDITQALTGFDINVEELTTECTEAAMSSDPLFKAQAQLSVGDSVDLDQVESALEQIANDLMLEFQADS
ncbi:MAG: ACT domain-containing protein [Pseudomonadota bacterium]